MLRILVWGIFFLSPLFASAIDFPRGLTKDDRQEVLRMLGFNTSTKLLTNPYPLGGYSGVEIGMSLEMVNIDGLSRLGNGTSSDQSDFRYPVLSLGKGLYENIDIFAHFIPPLPSSRLSEFGALVRWSFYQGQYVPLSLSITAHGNRISIQNSFSSQTYGGDFIAGLTMNNFSVYVGGGYLAATGSFTSGTGGDAVVDPSDPDVNPNSNLVSEEAFTLHSVLGVTLQQGMFFLAAQVDRYRDAVYSTKVGIRF